MAIVTIPSGQSQSDPFQLFGHPVYGTNRIAGIITPAGWDAAALTFLASDGSATFRSAFVGDGTSAKAEIAIAQADFVTTQVIMFTGALLALMTGAVMVKLRSGTNALAVNQTADRVFTLLLAPN